MLRPATPLSVLLLISFVLLLISTISTPVVHSIPLATNQGVNFGVFGYCQASGCSGIRVGYTTDGLFGGSGDGDFTLSSGARHSLSALLIVHPIAAFLNLVCLGLTLAAHFHSPSHSSKYLLGLLILLLPTLLVTLLAFLVDILIFAPHLKWGGWIVLASTILIAASGVVTCAMRRTLVARKARKRRIAENAEMSGENFYARQNLEASKIPVPPPLSAESKQPLVNGAPGADALPLFTSLDSSRRQSGDDRRLLNSGLPASPVAGVVRDDASSRYGPPSRSRSQPPQPSYARGLPSRSGSQPPQASYTNLRDEYGNPLLPSDAFGSGTIPPGAMRQQPEERRAPGAFGDGFGATRGGYGGPRGRGGYPSRGSYGPRGGYAGPRGPPPVGYNARGGHSQRAYGDRGRGGFPVGPMAAAAGAGVVGGAMMNRGPRQPPPSYPPQTESLPNEPYVEPQMSGAYRPQPSQPLTQYNQPGYNPVSPSDYGTSPTDQYVAYGSRRQSPAREQGRSPYGNRRQSPAGGFRQPSPPPPMPHVPGNMAMVGQAIEMDASTGHRTSPTGYGPPHGQFRDSDADVQGIVGLQQNRQGPEVGNSYEAASNDYVPPRAGWANAHHAATVSDDHLGIPTQRQTQSPAELPTQISNVDGPAYSPDTSRGLSRNRVNSGGSDVSHYYEDVNQRFVQPDPMPQVIPPEHETQHQLLQPGHGVQRQFGPSPNEMLRPTSGDLDPQSSYEELAVGARSPAESETSNFTSVSQRGVNPNWRPGGPGEVGSFGPVQGSAMGYNVTRRPVGTMARQQQEAKKDLLFQGNPDFEIPGMGASGRVRGGGVGGGMRGGGGIGRSQMGGMGAPSAVTGRDEGRYPQPGP